MRRSPDRVSLLVASMALRAARASSGCVSMTRLPTPAWMAMMPMLCATWSCNSRAIRSRSAVIASATSCDRSSVACCRRSRPRRPTTQAVTSARRAIVPITTRLSGPLVKPRIVRHCVRNVRQTAITDARRVRVATTYPSVMSTATNGTNHTGPWYLAIGGRRAVTSSIMTRAAMGLRRIMPTSRTVASAEPQAGRMPGARRSALTAGSSAMNGYRAAPIQVRTERERPNVRRGGEGVEVASTQGS